MTFWSSHQNVSVQKRDGAYSIYATSCKILLENNSKFLIINISLVDVSSPHWSHLHTKHIFSKGSEC